MERLTIGVDAKRIVRNGTGLGSYGRTLVNDLAQIDGLALRLYAPDAGKETLRRQVHEQDNLCFCYPDGKLTAVGKALWRSRGIIKQLKNDSVQLFHGLSGELPIGIRRMGIPTVVTIHDLIFLRHPEYYNPIDVKIYAWKFRQVLREATRIVAISECTRQDIVAFGGIPCERIDLIYQSCAPRFAAEASPKAADGIRAKYALPHRYVLSVGSIEERKNALLLVQALPFLPGDVDLVLVGRRTKYTEKVASEARRLGLINRLHMLHGVPDEDLPAIYAAAEVFAYPSRYEGFGIPVIEAIRMNLPVVACTGSCLEEAGGPDCLYVHPDDAEAMAHAIKQLLAGADGRMQRIANSLNYIRRFENSDAAQQFADLYRSMID